MHKFAKYVIKISSKMCEFTTYHEAINDLVYRERWREVIDEKCWNLN